LLTAAIDRDREAATHSDAYGPDCLPPSPEDALDNASAPTPLPR
jgi:hypothetical protein